MRAFGFTALALSFAVGCSTGSDDNFGSSGTGGAGSGGSMSFPGGGSQPMSLKFEEGTPVALAARSTEMFRVRATPPGVYRMSFGLPTSDGDPLDAVLDSAGTETDEKGIATVHLTAPSSPTMFQLRASVGSVIALWDLTVADTGVATVQVEPRRLNLSALRDITTWIATAYVDKTCAELPGIPPEDGPIVAPVAAKQDAPIIPEVPASTRLAITLRSGHFIGGCTTVESLPPGPLSSPQVVEVSLLNKPIDLSASRLNLALSLGDTGAAGWQSQLTEAGEHAQTALLGAGTDDVDALLDAMREASGDSRQLFENTRKAEAWDDLLKARWGQGSATFLRDLVGTWLTAGRQRFAAATPTFSGLLSPIADGASEQASAKLELSAVAGLDAAHAGFADSAQVAWSASADDTLALGTDLYFVRSQLATALAEAHALDNYVDAADASAALAQAVTCDELASALAAAGADGQLAYGACGTTCLNALCESALTSLWNRARDAEGLEPARLSLTATGKAYVGDGAEVAGLNGSWIGELGAGTQKVATGGTVTGSAAPGAK